MGPIPCLCGSLDVIPPNKTTRICIGPLSQCYDIRWPKSVIIRNYFQLYWITEVVKWPTFEIPFRHTTVIHWRLHNFVLSFIILRLVVAFNLGIMEIVDECSHIFCRKTPLWDTTFLWRFWVNESKFNFSVSKFQWTWHDLVDTSLMPAATDTNSHYNAVFCLCETAVSYKSNFELIQFV